MKIGISASAVWSQTERLGELFRSDVEHIEIGMFENLNVAEDFVKRAKQRRKSVGIHSPLVRGGSKYDLLEAVDLPTADAWKQIEEELDWCQKASIEYILIHFPFAQKRGTLNVPLVTEGTRRLGSLQARTGVKIVCEPKLGVNHDPAGIAWLRTAPRRIFSDAGLDICWDVGDHLLANRTEMDYFAQFNRWRSHISVIHLHNVGRNGATYRWTPPHPRKSVVDADYDLSRIVKQFPKSATIVSEYTPQRVATETTINTSFQYLKALTHREPHA